MTCEKEEKNKEIGKLVTFVCTIEFDVQVRNKPFKVLQCAPAVGLQFAYLLNISSTYYRCKGYL